MLERPTQITTCRHVEQLQARGINCFAWKEVREDKACKPQAVEMALCEAAIASRAASYGWKEAFIDITPDRIRVNANRSGKLGGA